MTSFCCEDMEKSINETESLFYSDAFDEYGIFLPEDSSSYLVIKFCPWCGKPLPPSKREEWFEELEEMGFENPLLDENIPIEYKSAKWRRKA